MPVPINLALQSGGIAKVLGGGGSRGKSGRKQRHRGQDQMSLALQEFAGPQAQLEGLFGEFLRGGGAQQNLIAGQGALGALLSGLTGAIGNVANPGAPLQLGLNAPGILQSLIARGQEQSAHGARVAAQNASEMLGTRGGAAARAITDIYRGSSSDAANLETRLRAEAAQQDLANRLGILGGLAGAMPAVTGGLNAAVGNPLDIMRMFLGIAGERSNIRRGLGSEYFQQGRDRRNERNQINMMLGQGAGMGAGGLMRLLGA